MIPLRLSCTEYGVKRSILLCTFSNILFDKYVQTFTDTLRLNHTNSFCFVNTCNELTNNIL